MKHGQTWIGVGLLQVLLVLPLAAAEFRAFAPVLHVEPVMETRYTPVTRQVCTTPDAAHSGLAPLAGSIGADIRAQLQRWQQQRHCRTLTTQSAREEIVAYRVTYRYGEETRTVRMAHHPGEQIPVTVSLSPVR